MIVSVRNILNHSQLSVFQEAQIFLNSVKMFKKQIITPFLFKMNWMGKLL